MKFIFAFLSSQIKQIREGGFSVLEKKVGILLSNGLLFLPALLCILVIRILRPFVIVRLGRLDISRIGAIYSADWYLSQKFSRKDKEKHFDIFYFTTMNKEICNQQWLKMWKRVLCVFPFWKLAEMVDHCQKKILQNNSHAIPLIGTNDFIYPKDRRSLENILLSGRPNICFTKEEEDFGQRALRKMGVPHGADFICFHARDSVYLKKTYPDRNWDYHDYRDHSIVHLIPSVQELGGKGCYAVRMGAVVEEKLAISDPKIIDYAVNGMRSDFMDIYLGAKCKFFICSDCGISIIPEMFRRPVVYTNWTIIKRISPWVLNGLFIFKKFYCHKERRFLTFGESMNLEFGGLETKKFFVEHKIELKENTPEEIRDVVIEMEQRLKGEWETTQEDEELQRRFWALFGPDKLKSPQMRIGAEFLRQNQGLLKSSEIHRVKVGVS